jgi:oxygen-dependent protoporphyrinogen oxidase
MAERLIPARHNSADESLGDFVRRRFGREALDRIIQPLVGGIYTSDPDRLSLAATMPRFLDMERQYGSLLKALRVDETADHSASGARYSMFATLPAGLSELIDALAAELKRTGVEFVASPITEIAPTANTEGTHWRVASSKGGRSFDAVIVGLPAYHAAELLRSWNAPLADHLTEIEYASSAIVLTGHRLSDISHALDGAGLVIPHRENRRIIAVSFASRKFPGRAPQGRVLLRTFVGGAMQPEMMNFGDSELKRIVREELAELLGAGGTADFEEVVRYNRGMPQYHVGHLDRVAKIDELCSKQAGLALCGNAYRGIGIPDAIESGTQAAERIWNSLTSARAPETSGVETP